MVSLSDFLVEVRHWQGNNPPGFHVPQLPWLQVDLTVQLEDAPPPSTVSSIIQDVSGLVFNSRIQFVDESVQLCLARGIDCELLIESGRVTEFVEAVSKAQSVYFEGHLWLISANDWSLFDCRFLSAVLHVQRRPVTVLVRRYPTLTGQDGHNTENACEFLKRGYGDSGPWER